MKYGTTEMARQMINDGMDILGGNGISRGPRNNLATTYIGTPIAITVEGANILTRTLMIFGQGAIRCHPYIYDEVIALQENDLVAFDRAFWGHMVHVLRNGVRSMYLSFSRGHLVNPPVEGPVGRYYQKLAWSSASFAFLADIALATLGGTLKRKEKLAGRFADIFSWMYFANAALKRFEAEGYRSEDLPYLEWGMEYAFERIQEGFDGLFDNLEIPVIGTLLKGPVALWSRLNTIGRGPSDRVGSKIASSMQMPGILRDRHTAGIFVPEDVSEALGRLEYALRLDAEVEGIERKIKDAVKGGQLPRTRPEKLVQMAAERKIITESEAALIQKAEAARNDAIQVDAFSFEEYMEGATIREPGKPTDIDQVSPEPPESDKSTIGII